MTEKKEKTALAKRDPVTQLAEYQAEHYNLLLPSTTMDQVPQGMRLSVREVLVDTSKGSADVYQTENGLAPSGHMLDKIASAAGVSWTDVDRLDDRKHPHYVEIQVKGTYVKLDGTVDLLIATASLDLREDAGHGIPGPDYEDIIVSAQLAKKPYTKRLRKARKFMFRVCESLAKNRAVRDATSMKGSYTKKELEKPFIAVKLVPDPSNKQAQELMLAKLTDSTNALYGEPATTVQDAEYEDSPGTESANGAGETEGGRGKTDPPTSPPPSENDEKKKDDEKEPDVNGDAISLINSTWTKASKAGITLEQFKGIVKIEAGQKNKDDMTIEDAKNIQEAVQKHIDGENEDCPLWNS